MQSFLAYYQFFNQQSLAPYRFLVSQIYSILLLLVATIFKSRKNLALWQHGSSKRFSWNYQYFYHNNC
jgi:hypothetical protein